MKIIMIKQKAIYIIAPVNFDKVKKNKNDNTLK